MILVIGPPTKIINDAMTAWLQGLQTGSTASRPGMVGSAVAGALSMAFKCGLHVPHGGVFVLPIPNAVDNLGFYVIAIVAGTLVTTGMLFLLKRPLARKAQAFAREAAVA